MNAIEILAEKLAKHPELEWSRGDEQIRVEPPRPEGFAIEFHQMGDEWTVYLGSGGWHHHFDDPIEALNFIAWCYSGEARVREVRRGDKLVKSVLEAGVDGQWKYVAVVGYLPGAFWRKKSEVILQNPNVISADLFDGNF